MQSTPMPAVLFMLLLSIPVYAHAHSLYPTAIIGGALLVLLVLSVYVAVKIRSSLRQHLDESIK